MFLLQCFSFVFYNFELGDEPLTKKLNVLSLSINLILDPGFKNKCIYPFGKLIVI